MSELDSLKAELERKEKEKQKYLIIADKIKKIYERMVEDKKLIKSYRNGVKNFQKENYNTFKGYLHENLYIVKIDELLAYYDTVIKNIDTNMDRLNTTRAEYENKAYQCNGVIGYLQSLINSLLHEIENCIN